MPSAEPIIQLRGLEKRYGAVHALSDVDLEVPLGPVGLLGPNGAGKTTMLKLLLGLLRPTAGHARIAGCDPRRRNERKRIRARVGYMPEGDCLMPGMTGILLVATLGRITGLSRQDAMTRAHEVLDYVQLEEARYRGLQEYSTGMKQRLKLAQALVHDPEVLLLDEPTNGLDPQGRRHMLDLVEDLGRAQGKNVLLCSHLLRDVEQTCDHVVVLHRGTVVEQGAIEDLTRADGRRLHVRVGGDADRFAERLAGTELPFERKDAEFTVVVPGETADADELFVLAAEAGVALTRVEEIRSTLEQVFLRAVGRDAVAAGEPA